MPVTTPETALKHPGGARPVGRKTEQSPVPAVHLRVILLSVAHSEASPCKVAAPEERRGGEQARSELAALGEHATMKTPQHLGITVIMRAPNLDPTPRQDKEPRRPQVLWQAKRCW
ncbi:hypothetical protein NDU88_000822 [Pleurodeles waltl]|uniref:Uncharacterized protein n=1 Tax=Pleurodeles waltl TaxID=8319 RepID=A0AAV7WGK9_PLEWA|nr:hypothetical protein NDU88_000822 [Pleurodeles waltl]